MKAITLALLPVAALVSCTHNSTTAQQPVGPAPQAQTANPYGIPGQADVGQYTPEAAPYQPVQPINPPALPPGASVPPPVLSSPNYPSPPSIAPPRTVPGIPAGAGASHTVVKGDSLWGLSRKYGVSADAIRQANGMASGDSIIRTGQTLRIPR